MDLLRLAGFKAVRVTSIWAPGLSAPDARTSGSCSQTWPRRPARTAFASTSPSTTSAARRRRSPTRTSTTSPRTRPSVARGEPDLPRLHRRQRAEPEPLLAAAVRPRREATSPRPPTSRCSRKTYDALKAVDPNVNVIGGAVSPRGIDRPGHGARHALADGLHPGPGRRVPGQRPHDADHGRVRHPPVRGQLEPAARRSRTRTRRRSRSPTTASSSRCSATAFDGTAQPGSTLPIVYDEFGVETQIPPAKAALYTGTEPATTKPVDEATQGDATTARRSRSPSASRTSTALFLFHAFDESDLDRWQSGVYYADGTPKSSLPGRDARDRASARAA